MARMSLRFEIVLPAHVVENFVFDRIKQHAVDGEIATLHILARIAAKADLIRMPAVRITNVTAEGCNLNTGFVVVSQGECLVYNDTLFRIPISLALAVAFSNGHQHDSKLRPHSISFRKDAHDFVGCGIRRNVIIGRLTPEQKIANATSN